MMGQLALVTGASQGIGRAIALALAGEGVALMIVGRRPEPLAAVAGQARARGSTAEDRPLDLVNDDDRERLVAEIGARPAGLDILVHCAGTIARANIADATIEDFDRQYSANVRAPFALTQALLPSLRRAGGQVVFVNSTAGLVARANASQFAATQHATRAVADALRDEVNGEGIRVTTIFAGRTATPRQERIHRWEGKPYHPDTLLQPDDIAAMVVAALGLPRTAEVTELTIRSMAKT
jgi:NADP-dependent 3-hydroxy acid dehydrogenase YdfG